MMHEFGAIVRHDGTDELVVVFTKDGVGALTEERFARFDQACGQRIRKVPTDLEEVRIEGYRLADPTEPLVSAWALVALVHEHFQIEVDLVSAA